MKPKLGDPDIVPTETFVKRTLQLALRAKGFVWIAATFGTVVLVTTSLRFGFSLAVIVLGVTIFLAFAFLFFLLSRAVNLPSHRTERPLLVVVWALTILFVGIILSLALSAIINKPWPFQTWILVKLGSSENVEKVAEAKEKGANQTEFDKAKALGVTSPSPAVEVNTQPTAQTGLEKKQSTGPLMVRLFTFVAVDEIPDDLSDGQRRAMLQKDMQQRFHTVSSKLRKVFNTSPYNMFNEALSSRFDKPPFVFAPQQMTSTQAGMPQLDLEIRYFNGDTDVRGAAEEVLRTVRVPYKRGRDALC